MDDCQWPVEAIFRVLTFDLHGDERSRPKFPAQGGFRKDGYTRGDLNGTLDVLDVIELKHDLDVDIVMTEAAIDGPANRQVAIESHESLAIKLTHLHRPPLGKPVGGMNRQNHDFFPPGDDRQFW